MTSLVRTIEDIKSRFGTKLAVGKIVQHPKHGRVIITYGYLWDEDTGRLSNHWHWRKVDKRGQAFGRDYSGYGWM